MRPFNLKSPLARSLNRNRRGSILSIVAISCVLTGLIVASVVSLTVTQRRVNLRKELLLQATTNAESAVDYAYSYITNEIDTAGLESSSHIPSTGNKTFALASDAISFLTSHPADPSGASTSAGKMTFSSPIVRVLPALPRARYFMDPKNPRMASDPNINQWVYETRIPVVARVVASQGGQSVVAHVRKDIGLREIPLFQYAIYYSGQAQIHRGVVILGDVHSNGPLILNAAGYTRYTGYLSTHSRAYRGSTIDSGGTGADTYGYTKVLPSGYLDLVGGVSPSSTGALNIYTETVSGSDIYNNLTAGFDSRMTGWKQAALDTFKGHLRDEAHEVPEIKPYGSEGYRQDATSTATVNEFNNGPYSLIEPLIPIGHAARKNSNANRLKLAANASLLIRIEARDPRSTAATPYTLYSSVRTPDTALPRTGTLGGASAYSAADLKLAKNITDAFIIRAYKYQGGPPRGAEITPTLIPVQLPTAAIGCANAALTGIEDNSLIEPYTPVNHVDGDGTTRYKITRGLHDSRYGRGVDLLTINMAELKRVMEASPSTLTGRDKDFRDDFIVTGSNREWNGIVYIEFPTSLDYSITASAPAKDGKVSYPFLTGSPELRHPDRMLETDSRPDRADKIVPIAPQLRRYYPGNLRTEYSNRYYAIPAVQVINAKKLPNPAESPGFTLATNVPVYLVGSYNSDGDYATGTNIDATAIDSWAQADTDEVSAAIFSDALTVLSDEWKSATQDHRNDSFYGETWGDGYPGEKRRVLSTNRIEIGACVATGEYPVFEFFTRALENFYDVYYGPPINSAGAGVNPIVFKGSLAAMFHSEIQHFKAVYDRNVNTDLTKQFQGHGQAAIQTVRFHQSLVNGIFPPGTPVARIPTQTGFRILRKGDADDTTVLSAAGF